MVTAGTDEAAADGAAMDVEPVAELLHLHAENPESLGQRVEPVTIRNSSAPRRREVPCAALATTAQAGISSRRRTTWAGVMSEGRSLSGPVTVTSPTGSPSSTVIGDTATAAPICFSASRSWIRLSFSPTPDTVTRAPGQAAAAARKNAAAEKSPGTRSRHP
jgi:hypothetical protein